MDFEKLSIKEFERYSRQIILPGVGTNGQLKLKNAKVLVVGAGGLGCPALLYLASAGVGTIGIVDFDKVAYNNLHRQILYTTEDIGKNKCDVVRERIAKLNPDLVVNVYNTRLDKHNAINIMRNYNIVLDGSDNFTTRYMVSDATVILNIPLIFGAVYQFLGQASVFNYNGGPTYRCLFPEQPKDGEVPSCATSGVIGVLPGIIGTLQANEALKIIMNIGETLSGKLIQIDLLSFKIENIEVKRDESLPKIESLGDYENVCGYNVKNLTKVELMLNLEDYLIIDIRQSEQYDNFNIGGINIPKDELDDCIDDFSREMKIVVVCQAGIQSEQIAAYMQNVKSFLNVYNLIGGINNWLNN